MCKKRLGPTFILIIDLIYVNDLHLAIKYL